MLHVHLSNYREAILDRYLIKATHRTGIHTKHGWPLAGAPLFLDRVIGTLESEQIEELVMGEAELAPGGGPSKSAPFFPTDIQHGEELLACGFSIEQVVYDYGDICHVIMDLIIELALPIKPQEFRTLNRCVNNAISGAVAAFAERRQSFVHEQEQHAMNRNASMFIDGLRQHVTIAALSFTAIKSGQAGVTGATSKALNRSLQSIRQLLDQPISDTLTQTAPSGNPEVILIDDLLGKLKNTIRSSGLDNNCKFEVYWVGDGLVIYADRLQINLAIKSLIDNAFTLSRSGGCVTMTAFADSERLMLDIQGQCGGLGSVDKKELIQSGRESISTEFKGDIEKGLAIARCAVEANDGLIMFRDLLGSGGVFTISLPLYVAGNTHQQDVFVPTSSASTAFPAFPAFPAATQS